MIFWTNFSLVTWLVLAAAVELLMAVVGIGQFFPPAVSALSSHVFAEFLGTLRPEHETVYYRFFIAAALIGQTLAVILLARRMEDEDFTAGLKPRALAEAVWMFVLLSAAFKAIAYQPRSQLAVQAFWVVWAAALLHKIFFAQVRHFWRQVWDLIDAKENARALRLLVMIGGSVLIAAIIAVPNPAAAVARFFIGEQFHHNDSFIMGPVLTVAGGLVPNWDVISQYGFGFPFVIDWLTKLWGGFSYEAVLSIMVTITLLYYTVWFWLLRRWLNSAVLALAAVILGIKWQMFHPGVYPFVFTYGSTTPVRFVWDALFFFALYRHLTTQQRHWFWLVGIAAGIQTWYLLSEGIYLTLAWWFYAGWVFIFERFEKGRPQFSDGLDLLRAAVVPVFTVFVLFAAVGGGAVFQGGFWANMQEFSRYFFSGFGVVPMTYNLGEKEFGAELMGFVMPLVYVGTIIMAGLLTWRKVLGPTALMAVILAVYGLGLYHYYVVRSTLTSYLVGGLPLAFLISFWVQVAASGLSDSWRRRLYAALLMGAVYALATTHLFIAYPNVLNLSPNPYTDPRVAMPLKDGKPYFHHLFRSIPDGFKFNANVFGQTDDGFKSEADFSSDAALVEYYRQAADFHEDAALIDKYTAADERVPLVCSFEIKMLIDAHRKPYFYYFPLVISRPLTMRYLAKTSIYTVDQLQKTVTALKTGRPPYVFMERIFTVRPLPEYFYQEFQSFLLLTDAILENYEPVEAGKYLLALKRKK